MLNVDTYLSFPVENIKSISPCSMGDKDDPIYYNFSPKNLLDFLPNYYPSHFFYSISSSERVFSFDDFFEANMYASGLCSNFSLYYNFITDKIPVFSFSNTTPSVSFVNNESIQEENLWNITTADGQNLGHIYDLQKNVFSVSKPRLGCVSIQSFSFLNSQGELTNYAFSSTSRSINQQVIDTYNVVGLTAYVFWSHYTPNGDLIGYQAYFCPFNAVYTFSGVSAPTFSPGDSSLSTIYNFGVYLSQKAGDFWEILTYPILGRPLYAYFLGAGFLSFCGYCVLKWVIPT